MERAGRAREPGLTGCPSPRWRSTPPVLVWLLGFAVAAAQAHIDGPAAAAVLDALAGDWSGTALRTPRGVLPYDICLERTPAGVGGVANPGAAFRAAGPLNGAM